MIYKYCRRCGRRLEGIENRLRGYGEICFEKAQREAQGARPLLSPTREQAEKQIKRLTEQEQRARAEAEQARQDRERLTERQRAEQESKAKRSQEESTKQVEISLRKNFSSVETPHLEKTLSPTSKKPLLFRPHTSPPPRNI